MNNLYAAVISPMRSRHITYAQLLASTTSTTSTTLTASLVLQRIWDITGLKKDDSWLKKIKLLLYVHTVKVLCEGKQSLSLSSLYCLHSQRWLKPRDTRQGKHDSCAARSIKGFPPPVITQDLKTLRERMSKEGGGGTGHPAPSLTALTPTWSWPRLHSSLLAVAVARKLPALTTTYG